MIPEAQHLHFRKYNLWWSVNAKKMKVTMRSRLRWSEETWCRNMDHCCICVWVVNEASKQDGVIA